MAPPPRSMDCDAGLLSDGTGRTTRSSRQKDAGQGWSANLGPRLWPTITEIPKHVNASLL
jgi:hypothetical protein